MKRRRLFLKRTRDKQRENKLIWTCDFIKDIRCGINRLISWLLSPENKRWEIDYLFSHFVSDLSLFNKQFSSALTSLPLRFSSLKASIRLHFDTELLSAFVDFSLIIAAQLKIEPTERKSTNTMCLLDFKQWEIPSIVKAGTKIQTNSVENSFLGCLEIKPSQPATEWILLLDCVRLHLN